MNSLQHLTTLADHLSAVADHGATIVAQVPDGSPTMPGNTGSKFNALVGAAKGIGIGISVIAMIGAGVSLGIEHRRGGGSTEGVGQIVKILLGVALISGAAGIVGFMI